MSSSARQTPHEARRVTWRHEATERDHLASLDDLSDARRINARRAGDFIGRVDFGRGGCGPQCEHVSSYTIFRIHDDS
jgi:hypothetical protein